jgi:glycosyltransferase involved in cell wall biosynthesis
VKTVLFYRDFRRPSGGHLKVWDYFNHVLSSYHYRPKIVFSPDTLWDESNPWLSLRTQALKSGEDVCPDALFLAGKDWLAVDPAQVPVINLIQHVRHAMPDDSRFPLLSRKAIRICVSEEVAEAIKQNRKVNGPIFVIPNGIDLRGLPVPAAQETDILIAALKQPELGLQLKQKLEKPGIRVELLLTLLPRAEYLTRVSEAKVTVFLPDRTEGFYLPALEGMALSTLVVCPDCVGNRSFCLDGQNCFRPEQELDSLAAAAEGALGLRVIERQQMLDSARQMAERHDLLGERRAFLRMLENLNQLW